MKKIFISLAFIAATTLTVTAQKNGGSKDKSTVTQSQDTPRVRAVKKAIQKRTQDKARNIVCRIGKIFRTNNPVAQTKRNRRTTRNELLFMSKL